MISVYECKARFQSLLRPAVRGLARIGVTPNQVTVAAALLSATAGAAVALRGAENPAVLWILPAVLFVRMALNAIDGMLAREHDMTSRLGGMLNEVGDVVSDAALFLPLAVVPGFSATWVALVVVAALTTEVAGLAAIAVGAPRRYDGPCGKSDRALVFGLLALLVAVGVPTGPWITVVLVGVFALCGWTVVQRTRAALEVAA